MGNGDGEIVSSNRKRRAGKQHWSNEYRKLLRFRRMDAILRHYFQGIITEDLYRDSLMLPRRG